MFLEFITQKEAVNSLASYHTTIIKVYILYCSKLFIRFLYYPNVFTMSYMHIINYDITNITP